MVREIDAERLEEIARGINRLTQVLEALAIAEEQMDDQSGAIQLIHEQLEYYAVDIILWVHETKTAGPRKAPDPFRGSFADGASRDPRHAW